MNETGRALWRFAVRGGELICPMSGCEWKQEVVPFGPDELRSLLRAAFRHLEDAHEKCEAAE